jgi:inosine-uridine nucleoside N-ribohydrolase
VDDPEFVKNVRQIIVLAGAFLVNGNVNPAAEANVIGDPEAADVVFICGADVLVIGINITHQVFLTAEQMEVVGRSKGKFGKYLYEATKFYFDYHLYAYDIDGIYLHDPTTMIAAIDPSLFTYKEGVVRVQQEGICRGMTVFSDAIKRYVSDNWTLPVHSPAALTLIRTNRSFNVGCRWAKPTEWCNKPRVKVAVTVDADKVSAMIKERLSA